MDLKTTSETLDIATLNAWIDSQRQEDLHLDFKLLQSAPALTRDGRKNLAKAISGFANSDGGLIVWGVDCRKDSMNVDCASGMVPVKNPAAVLSKLQSMTGDATVPIVDGVIHRVIEDSADSGIIVTYIPRSDAGPHMAMLGENRYYKRSGDSFYQMEHFDLADMFGRRPVAVLRVNLKPATGAVFSGLERSTEAQAIVGIENSGRGVARFPLLKITMAAPYKFYAYEREDSGTSGMRVLARGGPEPAWRLYAGGADVVVHPGTTLDVTVISTGVAESAASLPDLVVDYELAADAFPLKKGSESLAGERLLQVAKEAMDRSSPRKK